MGNVKEAKSFSYLSCTINSVYFSFKFHLRGVGKVCIRAELEEHFVAIMCDKTDFPITKNVSRVTRLTCRHGHYLRVTADRVEGIKDPNDEYSK